MYVVRFVPRTGIEGVAQSSLDAESNSKRNGFVSSYSCTRGNYSEILNNGLVVLGQVLFYQRVARYQL